MIGSCDFVVGGDTGLQVKSYILMVCTHTRDTTYQYKTSTIGWPLRWPGWSRSETLAPRTNRGLHRALIEVCTAHLHSAFAQRICTAHLHSAFAQRICTAHLHSAFAQRICTAHLHSAFAQRICTAHLHSAFAQRICTAHYYGMSDLLVTSSYIFLLKRGPNPILFLMMHRNDPEIESKAKLMTRACCNT